MKTRNKLINGVAVLAAVLTTAAASRVPAAQATTTAIPEKQYTGMVVSVNLQARTLKARAFLLSKQFNLGTACHYILLNKAAGTARDLRPGEKVKIGYQDVNGVLVADQVKQVPMRYTGMVKAIHPNTHTLILHYRGLDKTFQIPNSCTVLLRDNKSGTLADVHTGDYVTATYEKPGGRLVARQIAQTDIEISGLMTAVDLGEKMLKAKGTFAAKKFNVGDDCAIMIHGKPDGRLNDLRPDEHLVISYNEINGVNVVDRIAPPGSSPDSMAATTSPMIGN